jgi:hypothetical protein
MAGLRKERRIVASASRRLFPGVVFGARSFRPLTPAAGQWQDTKEMKNLTAILEAFRQDLPNSSLTAQAIDRGAVLEEISQAATMERIHQLAAILFEAEQEEADGKPDQEMDLETLINNQIRELRADLPDASKTAQAIDQGAAWEQISECAQQEGLGNLAATLFEAEQEKALEPAV